VSQGKAATKLIRVTLVGWLQLDILKCFPHDLSNWWQWWKSMRERDALSHMEDSSPGDAYVKGENLC
jgi:hypothetical protein